MYLPFLQLCDIILPVMKNKIEKCFEIQELIVARIAARTTRISQSVRELHELRARLLFHQKQALWLIQYEKADYATRKRMKEEKANEAAKVRAEKEMWRKLGL